MKQHAPTQTHTHTKQKNKNNIQCARTSQTNADRCAYRNLEVHGSRSLPSLDTSFLYDWHWHLPTIFSTKSRMIFVQLLWRQLITLFSREPRSWKTYGSNGVFTHPVLKRCGSGWWMLGCFAPRKLWKVVDSPSCCIKNWEIPEDMESWKPIHLGRWKNSG